MYYSPCADIENYNGQFPGPRPPNCFAVLKADQAADPNNPKSAWLEHYLKEYWRRSNSVASAAGPLVAQLAIRLFKATATLFAKYESQLQLMESQTGKTQPRADAGKGGKFKGSSAGAGGIMAAFKSVASAISQLIPSGSKGGRPSRHDIEDDTPGRCCSCKPVLRLEPA